MGTQSAGHGRGKDTRRLLDDAFTDDVDLDVAHAEATDLLLGGVDLGCDVRALQVRQATTHPRQRGRPWDQRPQRAHGTRRDHIEHPTFRPLLGSETLHNDVLEPERIHLLGEPDGPTLHRLDQRELDVGSSDRQDDARKPGSRADVRHTSREERCGDRAIQDVP